MRIKTSDEKLLREYVHRVIIREYFDDYGVSPYTDKVAMGTYGSSLKSLFIDPFINAFKVIGAEAKKLGVKVIASLRVMLEAALSLLVPQFEADYQKIFDKQSAKIDEIKKKYQKAYDAVDAAYDNPDVKFFAFMLNPAAWLSVKMINSDPEKVIKTCQEVYGNADKAVALFLRDIRNQMRYGRVRADSAASAVNDTSGAHPMESTRRSSRRLNELEKQQKLTPNQIAVQMLTSPEFKKLLQNSEVTREMRQDAAKILGDTANEMQANVNSVMAVKNAQDLASLAGGKWKPDAEYAKLDPAKKAEVDGQLTGAVKGSMRAFYTSKLQAQDKQLEDLGVAANSPYRIAIRNMLAKLSG